MKPPPPMLPAVGWTTASAKAVATAASTAVPPAAMTSAPILDAALVLRRDHAALRPGRHRAGAEGDREKCGSNGQDERAGFRHAADYTRLVFHPPRRNRTALTTDISENAIAIAQKMPGGP